MTAAPPRIAIVSYNWPPRNASGTHRPYSWARNWAARGAKVTVLTAKKYDFDEPLDLELAGIPGVEVIETPFLDPARSKLASLLKAAGRQWIRRAKLITKRLRGRSIDLRERWCIAARSVAGEVANRSDLVISTFGPTATHLIASDMKRANPQLRWIADYRDPWSSNIHSEMLESERALEQKRELETIASADLLTTVSAELAQSLSEFSGKRAEVVENGFDISEEVVVANLANRLDKPRRPFRIVHTGMIYSDLRDPEPLLRALAAMRGAGEIGPGDVAVEFYGNLLAPLAPLTANPVYRDFIRIQGHVPRAKALEEQRTANLLLLLETPKTSGTVPAKVYEYLTSGTPVISVGSRKDSAVGKLLQATGGGICLERDVDAIRAVLGGLLRGEAPAWFHPDVEQILIYSRQRRADRMFELIEETLFGA